MTIDRWVSDLEREATRPYFRRLDILERGRSLIKARLIISTDLFVQVYRNERYDSTNLVLIYNGQRLYGRDQLGGSWHRHSADTPADHDRSTEGRRPISLHEFLDEVEAVLNERNLP